MATIELFDTTLRINDVDWRDMLHEAAYWLASENGVTLSDEAFEDFMYDHLEYELESALNIAARNTEAMRPCDPEHWRDELLYMEKEV